MTLIHGYQVCQGTTMDIQLSNLNSRTPIHTDLPLLLPLALVGIIPNKNAHWIIPSTASVDMLSRAKETLSANGQNLTKCSHFGLPNDEPATTLSPAHSLNGHTGSFIKSCHSPTATRLVRHPIFFSVRQSVALSVSRTRTHSTALIHSHRGTPLGPV